MQIKTTRAFRTISEAGEELDLQPHVLRFWESKFPQIKPMKRGGGRRFYRPEDIEFLRGIKILLHDEKHPIKDVQKLIRVKGAGRIMELGRSIERASKPKAVEDVDLIPERIVNFVPASTPKQDTEILRPISAPVQTPMAKAKMSEGVKIAPVIHAVSIDDDVVVPEPDEEFIDVDLSETDYTDDEPYDYVETEVDIDDVREGDVILDDTEYKSSPAQQMDTASLEDALERLKLLKGRWIEFKSSNSEINDD